MDSAPPWSKTTGARRYAVRCELTFVGSTFLCARFPWFLLIQSEFSKLCAELRCAELSCAESRCAELSCAESIVLHTRDFQWVLTSHSAAQPQEQFFNSVVRVKQAQLPRRNRTSAMHFFVAKLLSIAIMTYIYHLRSDPMIRLICYAHSE